MWNEFGMIEGLAGFICMLLSHVYHMCVFSFCRFLDERFGDDHPLPRYNHDTRTHYTFFILRDVKLNVALSTIIL